MNLQSILLVILLAGAFLLALKKSKGASCSSSCPNCPYKQECSQKSKGSISKNFKQ